MNEITNKVEEILIQLYGQALSIYNEVTTEELNKFIKEDTGVAIKSLTSLIETEVLKGRIDEIKMVYSLPPNIEQWELDEYCTKRIEQLQEQLKVVSDVL